MAYKKKTREKAKKLYRQGFSVSEISGKIRVTRDTLHRWKKKDDWDSIDEGTFENIRAQINAISASFTKGIEPSDSQLGKLNKLTSILARLEGTKRNVKKAEKVKKEKLSIEVIGSIEDKGKDGLYQYQRDFLDADSRFQFWLKSRQIGLSYTLGLKVLLMALRREYDQYILAASQRQSDIVRTYSEYWAEKLGIEIVPAKEGFFVPGGNRVFFLPANFRTAQGCSGDLWLDEFAWHQHTDMIYNFIMPTVTQGDRRACVITTPYVAFDQSGRLWNEVETYTNWLRRKIDIHEAVKQGLDVDLGEIRKLFDEGTFRQLYECEFFSDEMSLFTYREVQDAIMEDVLRYVGAPVYGGYDIARRRHLSACVLSEAEYVRDELTVYVRAFDAMRQWSFDHQKEYIRGLFLNWNIENFRMDETGIGLQMVEDLARQFAQIEGVWMDRRKKESLALGTKMLFERQIIRIPSDPELMQHIHAIKRIPGEAGFKYDSAQNEQIKHADLFWALALSVSEFGWEESGEVGVEDIHVGS